MKNRLLFVLMFINLFMPVNRFMIIDNLNKKNKERLGTYVL